MRTTTRTENSKTTFENIYRTQNVLLTNHGRIIISVIFKLLSPGEGEVCEGGGVRERSRGRSWWVGNYECIDGLIEHWWLPWSLIGHTVCPMEEDPRPRHTLSPVYTVYTKHKFYKGLPWYTDLLWPWVHLSRVFMQIELYNFLFF